MSKTLKDEKVAKLLIEVAQLTGWKMKLLVSTEDPDDVGGIILADEDAFLNRHKLEEDADWWSPPEKH